MRKLNLPVNTLIESLGKWTLNNLETLNISESSLTDPYKLVFVVLVSVCLTKSVPQFFDFIGARSLISGFIAL